MTPGDGDGRRVVDQQLVVHVFAPTDGPHADVGYRALRDVWLGCRHLFGMGHPVPGLGLPHLLPAAAHRLSLDPAPDREHALAAQEGPAGDCQAVLRVHHDVLNLSLALAPSAARVAVGPSAWTALDQSWEALLVGRAPDLLGETRLYLASVELADEPVAADDALAGLLAPMLPSQATEAPPGSAVAGVTAPCGPTARAAIWEPVAGDDARFTRRWLVAAAATDDAEVGAWLWTRGDPAIPPLARYLLHAAKIRYQLRVWRRDGRVRELRDQLEASTTELRALLAGGKSPARAGVDRLLDQAADAALMAGDLRQMRQTVEIAAGNMALAVGHELVSTDRGPFAEDRAVARMLLERLADAGAYLDAGIAGSDRFAEAGARALARTADPPTPDDPPPTRSETVRLKPPQPTDVRRNVFVVHGRDLQVRDRMFDFLRSVDLRPLEWESLVDSVGSAAPFVGDVVAHAVTVAQAAVVLLTPDDVVTLHPALHDENDGAHETSVSLQPRPNVFLELGMALVAFPDSTLIVGVGARRPVGDLAGRNYIELSDSPQSHQKLVNRLRVAGCQLDLRGDRWLTPGRFADLDAYRRRPVPWQPSTR